jgi:hypothetical protein
LVFLGGCDPRVLVRCREEQPASGASGGDSSEDEGPRLPPPPPPAPPLWVPLARALLVRLCPTTPPALALLSAGQAGREGAVPPSATGLGEKRLPPGPLARMAAALTALGPLATEAAPLELDDWCWGAPLWCNPLLPAFQERRADPVALAAAQPQPHGGGPAQDVRVQPAYWQRHGLAFLAALAPFGLATAGELCALRARWLAWRARRVAANQPLATMPSTHASFLAEVWAMDRSVPASVADLVTNAGVSAALIEAMWGALPGGWQGVLEAQRLAALRPGAAALPTSAAAVATLLPCLGWQQLPTPRELAAARAVAAGAGPAAVGAPQAPRMVAVVGRSLTVRAATRLQLGAVLDARYDAHASFVAAAHGGAVAPADTALHCVTLASALKATWGLEWENQPKEVLWRLAVGGVPAAGGHGICPKRPCLCGFQPPAPGAPPAERAAALQLHAFWADAGAAGSCPIAGAVLDQLRRALPPAAGATFARHHLWLLQPPEGSGVCQELWRVVGLAALSAMWYGRRCAWAFRQEAEDRRVPRGGLRQATLEEAWAAALRRAVAADGDVGAGPAPPPPAAAPQGARGAGLGAAAAAPAAGGGGAAAQPPRRRGQHRPRPPTQRAASRAAADFWCTLGDFASLGPVPDGWRVAGDSPFLAAAPGAARAGGGCVHLRVNIPAAAA